MKKTTKLLLLLSTTIVLSCNSAKKTAEANAAKKAMIAKKAKADKLKKQQIQPYSKIVTKEAKTDDGLFKIHTIGDKYLYEIPDSLFDREMLMVTRIAKTANGLGFGGGKENTQVLRWQVKDKKVLLRVVSNNVVADKSLPIHEAVVNSNFEPILYAFPIKAFSKDSTATVIDVTDLYKKDVNSLGLSVNTKKRYKVTRLDDSKSYIESVKSYPLNIEARHVKTYYSGNPPSNSSTGTISIEMNNSMILLPKTPMKRRYFDKRVGWFTSNQTDYGLEAQKSKNLTYLDRWKLEVKDEDLEKFKNGELVEPKKQIVYYIDRATPVKWRKYIKQGIEDWQTAFEAAGFKNAIIAKDPPSIEEDPEWTPEDARYSVVRYLASPIPNANGPHVSDPRSGEILESDINWYHNVMSLVNGWFFTQTAAANKDAQNSEFSDEVMGELIRFVSSHEVGHTLGLPHNMGSSSAYKVEDLRDPEFTKKYGTAPSIMDYARFNYIAQPEDVGVSLFPNIGIYDKYAIAWGYKPILDKTAVEEKETLDSWIMKHNGDPLYRFGKQQRETIDPSSQTEDLGDDAVLASTYGIKNLKRVVPNLIEWTTKNTSDYDDLKTMYGHVFSQFNRYMGHVSNNIGGVYENYKTADQEGDVYSHVDKDRQKESLLFINDQLFKTPEWLISPEINNKLQASGIIERINALQTRTLNSILSTSRMERMIENESLNGNKAYKLTSMMSDLRKGVWKELYTGKNIDTYKRNLQRAHVSRLAYLMTSKSSSDIKAISRAELTTLRNLVRSRIGSRNAITNIHLRDMIEQINQILDPKQ
ncbi:MULTISPECIES: zinc-dependent metalloprotease [unclassified Algibacter]|uniref:zinc-dependent metalloprotease n=1 Tax=unclassified Algibacter TaxID=2615009 RepID=UPI001E404E1B|nr:MULTISPECIES: zinc-dependent metalloprotease [unclassified Algibacter]MCL5130116.1 zinc-dependent metalloprotease [Algibacter sp. L4_22]